MSISTERIRTQMGLGDFIYAMALSPLILPANRTRACKDRLLVIFKVRVIFNQLIFTQNM